MERLTKPATIKNGNKYTSAIGSGAGAWPRIIQRLAEYENTGMEPEEINQLREFTESATNTTLRHIYELVQAEKEGRLVIKPTRTVKATAQAGQYSEDTLLALERMGAKAHRDG